MQAVALERRYGRIILPSLHGAWTFGGIVGAALTLATSAVPLGWTGLLAVVPLLVAGAAFLPRAATPIADAAPEIDIPWRPIVLVGLGMVVF